MRPIFYRDKCIESTISILEAAISMLLDLKKSYYPEEDIKKN